jgi:hypothetical protein
MEIKIQTKEFNFLNFNIKKIIFCLDEKYYIMSPNQFTRHYTTEGQHYINNSLRMANHYLLQEDECF